MDIALYREKCGELRQKHGEEHYSREKLNAAWAFWKDKPDAAFLEFFAEVSTLPFAVNLLPTAVREMQTDSGGATDGAKAQGSSPPEFDSPIEHVDAAEDIGMRSYRPKGPPSWRLWKEEPPIDQALSGKKLEEIKQQYGVESVAEIISKGLWKNEREQHHEKLTSISKKPAS